MFCRTNHGKTDLLFVVNRHNLHGCLLNCSSCCVSIFTLHFHNCISRTLNYWLGIASSKLDLKLNAIAVPYPPPPITHQIFLAVSQVPVVWSEHVRTLFLKYPISEVPICILLCELSGILIWESLVIAEATHGFIFITGIYNVCLPSLSSNLSLTFIVLICPSCLVLRSTLDTTATKSAHMLERLGDFTCVLRP